MSASALARLAILISGRGSNMTAIVRACQTGALRARPVVVISDRDDAAGLASARELGVETLVLAAQPDVARFERSLGEALEAREPQWIALAGFMRFLSPGFVSRYLGRMLNIHPSLLPAYRGLHTHHRVLTAGEREHGDSVHFITA